MENTTRYTVTVRDPLAHTINYSRLIRSARELFQGLTIEVIEIDKNKYQLIVDEVDLRTVCVERGLSEKQTNKIIEKFASIGIPFKAKDFTSFSGTQPKITKGD